MKNTRRNPSRQLPSPLRLLLILGFSIFTIELLIMFLFRYLHPQSDVVQALLDSVLLLGLSFPALYFFVFRRLLLEISERKEAQAAQQNTLAALELSNNQLEDAIGKSNEMAAQAVLAQAMLEESSARYRAVTEFATDAIITSDSKGKIIGWNRSAESIFGYTETESNGQSLTMLMPSTYYNAHNAGMVRVNSGGEEHMIGKTVEAEGRRKDGSVFPIEISLAKWQVNNSHFYSAIIRDIVLRKQSEVALRESEQNYRTLANSGQALVWMAGKDKLCYYFNSVWLEFTGHALEQEIGNGWLEGVHPDDFKHCMDTYVGAFDRRENFSMEYRLRRHDGEYCWILDEGCPRYDSNREFIGYIGHCLIITERKRLEDKLKEQATTDELTGIANRRYMIELANGEIRRAVRGKRPLSIALFDIDHFKFVNDTLGHAAGDQALLALTQICNQNVRGIDTFARFGGDEFALLLPESDGEQAFIVAERIRLAITEVPLDLGGKPVSITISSGIASLSGDQDTFDEILSRADKALYEAKESGRNRVVIEHIVS